MESNILATLPYLTPETITKTDLKRTKFQFHPLYQIMNWYDGPAPITIQEHYWIAADKFYVRYKCSNKSCPKCNQSISPGHLKFLNPDGTDYFGRVCSIMKKKGKFVDSDEVLIPEPVFMIL